MSIGKVVLGTMAGFATGVLTGILFAPEKGSVTRREIRDKANEFVDELKLKYDEFCDTLTDKLDNMQYDVENLTASGKDKYEDVKRDVKHAASKLQHEVGDDVNQQII